MTQDVSSRGAVGSAFAGVLMIIAGIFGILQGISGVAKGSFYVQPTNYWITTSASAWGWWHIIVSVIVLGAGLGIFLGSPIARWIGIVFVALQAITNFLFIPYQPFWALILILVDLWIIHSLFVNRRELV